MSPSAHRRHAVMETKIEAFFEAMNERQRHCGPGQAQRAIMEHIEEQKGNESQAGTGAFHLDQPPTENSIPPIHCVPGNVERTSTNRNGNQRKKNHQPFGISPIANSPDELATEEEKAPTYISIPLPSSGRRADHTNRSMTVSNPRDDGNCRINRREDRGSAIEASRRRKCPDFRGAQLTEKRRKGKGRAKRERNIEETKQSIPSHGIGDLSATLSTGFQKKRRLRKGCMRGMYRVSTHFQVPSLFRPSNARKGFREKVICSSDVTEGIARSPSEE